MKKLVTLSFVAVTMSIVACGPSAEEKAKLEAQAKAKMDSLFNAAATQAAATIKDSTATPAPEATTPAATEEKK